MLLQYFIHGIISNREVALCFFQTFIVSRRIESNIFWLLLISFLFCLMQDTLFLSLARKVVYISSIAIFGTIASIVMYATFAAFTGPSSGPSATNHSRGLLYDYMFGAATNSGAVQQGTNWNSVPSSGTSALAGTVNEKLNFVVSKLLTGISTAALDGVYDSTAVAANKNGNALNMLKYLIQGQDAGAASPASSGCENMDVYRS